MNKIAPAFIKAKKEFPPVLKTSSNPFFKSKYADLAACIGAIDDAFLNNGIVMYQETFEDATGVTVETVLLHESGEVLRCGKLHMPAVKHDAQAFGSALTYCRRYSLMTACGIAAEDDDGSKAVTPKPAPLSKEQVQAVNAANDIIHYFTEGDFDEAYRIYDDEKDTEIRLQIWSELQPHSKIRSTLKKMAAEKAEQSKGQ